MNNELMHYGVQGMKWGQHLFMRKDGTLNSLGTRYYNRQKQKLLREQQILSNRKQTAAKFEKLSADRAAVRDELNTLSGKKVKKSKSSKTTTADIANSATPGDMPKTASAGKRFFRYVGSKIVGPALTEGSKRALTNVTQAYLETAFGIKGGKDGPSKKEKTKTQNDQNDQGDKGNKGNKGNQNNKNDKNDKNNQNNKINSNVKNDQNIKNDQNNHSQASNSSSSTTEHYHATGWDVEGTGTNSSAYRQQHARNSSQQSNNRDTVVDVDWEDVTPSSRTDLARTGRRYIAGLIG